MTRREKAQRAILANIHDRPNDQLGAGSPPLELEEYEAKTINAIAREMTEIEQLIEADIESDADGDITAVIPRGLTERGAKYLELLKAAP